MENEKREITGTPNTARLTVDERTILSMLSVLRNFEQRFVNSMINSLIVKGDISAKPPMFDNLKEHPEYFKENTFRYITLRKLNLRSKVLYEVEPSVGISMREEINVAHKQWICRFALNQIHFMAEDVDIEPSLDNIQAISNIIFANSNFEIFTQEDVDKLVLVCDGLKKNPKTRCGGYWASWVNKAKETFEQAELSEMVR